MVCPVMKMDLDRRAARLAAALMTIVIVATPGGVAYGQPTSTTTSDSAAPVGDDDPTTRAKAAYRRGTKAYAEARFDDALAAFQEASALVASPDLLFNIGLCHEQLEQYEDAIRTFEAYLAAKPDASDGAAVAARIQRLGRARGRAAASESTTPPAPAPTRIDVRPPDDRDDGADTASETSRPRRWRPLLGLGVTSLVTGVGVAAAGIAPAMDAARGRDALDEVNAGNPADLTAAQVRQIQTDIDRANMRQVVLFSVGGSLAVAGIVMTAIATHRRRDRDVRPAAWLGPAGGGVGWMGRF